MKLESFSGLRFLIVGDVMLDEFQWCSVSRISPEAPVPVCKVETITYLPGGAANVAANAASLGGEVTIIGQIGKDAYAEQLKSLFIERRVSIQALLEDPSRHTSLKTRVIARHQHVARVDRESHGGLSESTTLALLKSIEENLPNAQVLVLSDYNKGVLSKEIAQAAIRLAKKAQIPVIVDPKGEDYSKYAGATVITPNFKEFQEAVQTSTLNESEIQEKGYQLIRALDITSLVITRSEKGMTILTKDGKKIDIPTKALEVTDITGAGDTVVAALGLGLGAELGLEEAVTLANYAAGIVVGKVGTATTTQEELLAAVEADK